MKLSARKVASVLLVTAVSHYTFAQNDTRTFFNHSVAFTVERSIKSGYKVNQDYSYVVTTHQVELERAVTRNSDEQVSLHFLVIPQYNTTDFHDWEFKENRSSWEAGINAGLKIRVYPGKDHHRVFLFASISSGPHYIDRAPVRQNNGFIFNNNFRFGFHFPIAGALGMEIKAGLRHMSNLGLFPPNHGLDNVMIGGNLNYAF
ncbi:acyloxyacyl hydrolase [Siphonobacter sp. SORGH_AS_0500]|uniref:acyloxyacyl hydrolase n=1 Tax=Siphonobacter sp. SORGH_AS_0500 TaxID=1864824 RepID=UPI0028607149|nr:acyloxyacyl hydrolase [Siphonobacter sp. SORGH_AS_0500]MDR6195257.1 hypothetical protein [Siphonobacter sp. SORGH_AS_0500]